MNAGLAGLHLTGHQLVALCHGRQAPERVGHATLSLVHLCPVHDVPLRVVLQGSAGDSIGESESRPSVPCTDSHCWALMSENATDERSDHYPGRTSIPSFLCPHPLLLQHYLGIGMSNAWRDLKSFLSSTQEVKS